MWHEAAAPKSGRKEKVPATLESKATKTRLAITEVAVKKNVPTVTAGKAKRNPTKKG